MSSRGALSPAPSVERRILSICGQRVMLDADLAALYGVSTRVLNQFSPALPCAFTEHGAIMLASVLNTPIAVQASVQVVRAFVRLREMLWTHKDLARKLMDESAGIFGAVALWGRSPHTTEGTLVLAAQEEGSIPWPRLPFRCRKTTLGPGV